MANKKAIITLAIGEQYLQMWENLCQANWQKYAAQHGFDVICIDRWLDTSKRAKTRSPAWQKCLILSQEFSKKYERIIWVDSDVLINPTSPCITLNVPPEKVGAVDAAATPSPDLVRLALERLYDFWDDPNMYRELETREYYTRYGLFPAFDQMVRTGVLVMSPAHHRELLEKAYYNEEERKDDMRYISHELLKADCVHWIDGRFDPVWLILKALHYPFLLEKQVKSDKITEKLKQKLMRSENANQKNLIKICLNAAFRNNYFMHFAGCVDEMSLVEYI